MPTFKPVIITTTTATREEAEKIALALLQNQIAACVQYETVTSHYVWQDEVCRDEEIRMVIKSSRCHYKAVEKLILAYHSYDCPQILMQPVSRGLSAYLRWMKAQMGL
ncbi:divalent-cation tolerance protein CutA [Neisseria iguanae]|uniref:Divalent-cation tolerance protein CutA n=1 Tax=Neisseria iguanae TaxID=90242 RepID=A0A2P7U0Z2_9NEIS|nr:divalent-cation tolerance protein CutA [Neisseria iguanae]PSJ80573.1 divalent-cation tolerance protein CutA [Neisseria iguanae]